MEIEVTKWLPNNGERVLCFGHKTYCCKEDMDKEPAWHDVVFEISIDSYSLKPTVPDDPEESILKSYNASECWHCFDDKYYQVIGVTKWKKF